MSHGTGNEDSREDDNAGDSENHNDCDSKIDDKGDSFVPSLNEFSKSFELQLEI